MAVLEVLTDLISGRQPIVLASLLVIATVVVYGFRPLGRWKLRHLPGPPSYWMVGGIMTIFSKGVYKAYYDWTAQYGKIFKVQFGAAPVVVISDPEVGRLVNLRNMLRPPLKGPVDMLKGPEEEYQKANMLLTQDREYHRSLKNAWLPFFYSGSLDGYAAEMAASADILVDRLAKAAEEKRSVNIWRMLGEMTMDVVGTCAFGVKLRTQEVEKEGTEEARALIGAARSLFQLGQQASYYFIFFQLFPFTYELMRVLATAFPDQGLIKVQESREILLETSKKLLKIARQEQQDALQPTGGGGKAKTSNDKDNQAPAHTVADATSDLSAEVKQKRAIAKGGFLQLLVNAKHKDGRLFSDEEIVQQAFTFLLAGYETTASTLAFCVYNLARYPDKLAKLLAEVDGLPKDHVPSVDELASSLPYLNAVFKETLRLYPVGILTVRALAEDCNLLGYDLKKGTQIHVNTYGIHRDPDTYNEPEEFIPERWIDGTPESTGIPHNSWFPFGDGNLVCVGMRFAQEEAKIALLRIFQRFTFKLEPGQIPLKLAAPLTLGPKEGIFVTPEARF